MVLDLGADVLKAENSAVTLKSNFSKKDKLKEWKVLKNFIANLYFDTRSMSPSLKIFILHPFLLLCSHGGWDYKLQFQIP